MPDAYIITSDVLQSIVNYLASRPFLEVHEGITALGALMPYELYEPAQTVGDPPEQNVPTPG